MSKLKSCPFCGGEAIMDRVDEGAEYRPWYWYTAHCSNRDCVCSDLCHEYETEAEAIDAWNTRAGSGECELVETESYSNANEVVHVFECSACGETCEHVNGAYPRCPHCGAHAKDAGTTREAADDSGHAYSDDDDDDWYY